MGQIRRVTVTVILVGLAAALGCQAKIIPYGVRFENLRDDLTLADFKVRTLDYTRYLTATIEQTANRVYEATDDMETRRHALLLKINGVPAAQQAGFKVDPAAAAFDLWVFVRQCILLFEGPEGEASFGALQPMVVDAFKAAERELELVAAWAMISDEGLENVRAVVYEWAEKEPIQGIDLARDSDLRGLGQLGWRAENAFQAIRALEEVAIDLSVRSAQYAGALPKQAKWQTQLAMMDIENSETVRSIHETTESAFAAADAAIVELQHVNQRLEAVEARIDATQVAVEEGFDGLGVDIALAAQGEREEAIIAVAAERQRVLEDISQQREETVEVLLATVEKERELVLDAVQAERQIVMRDLESLTDASIEDVDQKLTDLVDYVVVRVLALAALAMVVIPIVTVVTVRLVRERA